MILYQSKDLEKNWITKGNSRDVICPQKIERQQRTPVIVRWYKKQDKKKGKTRSSEYSSTNI